MFLLCASAEFHQDGADLRDALVGRPRPRARSSLRLGLGTVARRVALVTGSSGLIGSETVTFLDRDGWLVHGVGRALGGLF